MNLFLHNIGDIDSDNNISPADALIAPADVRYDYVLANPPFGKKSKEGGESLAMMRSLPVIKHL